jgi:hypothetical protein
MAADRVCLGQPAWRFELLLTTFADLSVQLTWSVKDILVLTCMKFTKNLTPGTLHCWADSSQIDLKSYQSYGRR